MAPFTRRGRVSTRATTEPPFADGEPSSPSVATGDRNDVWKIIPTGDATAGGKPPALPADHRLSDDRPSW
ncbi:hypothetical protein KL86PLE_70037 [uncultured Pleomorphomonas sp.]|uniref:Uncharacterized protein n=1 Tax=uncultured Pleomorphomonas sp. TaxID=442121 RepID=A0A212LL33_9HYPH|nr:hypothetical protein KL86PLE_70037 [uncultured Pleomorphomonas sp.]